MYMLLHMVIVALQILVNVCLLKPVSSSFSSHLLLGDDVVVPLLVSLVQSVSNDADLDAVAAGRRVHRLPEARPDQSPYVR